MNEKKKEIQVLQEDTLLNCLSQNLKDLSNKQIKSYIKHQMVEVDKKVITNSSTLIKKDSTIVIYFTKRLVPKINLEIIYEDEDLIAINKPSGLLSISNPKEKEQTAFRLVSDYIKVNNPKAKLFVVHRLDQDTSGVLLFSKNLKLKEKLQDNWDSLVKKREYTCAVIGKMPDNGRFETYLAMNHFQIVYSTSNKELGKLAITNYKTVTYKNHYSLLKVEIETGRRNQIRVHMSENGHPIAGDKKYGAKVNPIGRLALHASELDLIDPRNKKLLVLKSETPKEILNLVK